MFFPSHLRDQVAILYAFVRTADDFVDAIPADARGFSLFRQAYEQTKRTGKKSENKIIDDFVNLSERFHFEESWVSAFLDAMKSDLSINTYKTLPDLQRYMYGSAAVVGLMMARLMGVPDEGFPHAGKLGESMQLINFIRDIEEDNGLGRTYIPQDMLKKYELTSLQKSDTQKHPQKFVGLIHDIIALYRKWAEEASQGYAYIPWRYRIAVRTASDMYLWTANEIQNNPFLVYEKKVKPTKLRIIVTALTNCIFP